MTLRTFCQSGVAEWLKGGVHGGILLLAIICLAYNLVAYVCRGRGRHLIVNVCVYAALTAFEWMHVLHHCERPQ